jgi:hypothetical protein
MRQMRMNPRVRALVSVLLAFAASVSIVLLVSEYLSRAPSAADTANLQWYVRKAEQWELQARILRTAQVVLAVLAITSSVLAASEWRPPRVSKGALSVLAAISIALLTGLDLTPQANKIRSATRHLSAAILKHHEASPPTLDDVRKAYEEAETLVGDYSPNVGR